MFERDDLEQLQAKFARNGRVVVPDFLPAQLAARTYAELCGALPWEIAIHTPEGPAAIPHDNWSKAPPFQKKMLFEQVRQQAMNGFAFLYKRLDLIPGDVTWLAELKELLASDAFIDFLKCLTNDETITRIDAHATLYEAGHFLKQHDDTYVGKNRRLAYVIGLTNHWQADWGGMLHFQDKDGNVLEAIVPRFNTLTLFRVPTNHFVSQVSHYAPGRRYAVTGWAFAPDPVAD